MRRKEHTPGESKKRNQARADFRSDVAIVLQEWRNRSYGTETAVSSRAIAETLSVPYQRVVSALNQLVTQGLAIRVSKGLYSDGLARFTVQRPQVFARDADKW